MFCLRSWLPLLFIPTNASPLFIISYVALTYILHRPCIYCSALLLILFISSCHWSDRCFFDLRGDWFSPRYPAPVNTTTTNIEIDNCTQNNLNFTFNESLAGYIFETMNTTTKALAGAAVEEAQRRLAGSTSTNNTGLRQEWAGMGLEWLRSLLGKREWTLPCVDVKVRL
ncbi:hypothetical protein ASPZODRAFT_18909 [Penicilliopsis zonata CBS 506.65]|uniref:Uncharacterized protein n=1 Tax=Penicilliopsis zonata CBS 506.65 TaxID=1073090 RepID=A0A1L9SAF1_9EURO|nr:hypothetical protein ASPZODRAFT_18909 [Penicilliopsis zonata CBS 506.65]OJJ44144.1 hypothetical protein ASPZODRAFT_18909 [Penicilliopsis zonata CBS 506.65]